MRRGLQLLLQPDVARLFTAYLISYMGTAMAPIALAFGVLELTGSAADASVVIAAPTLASICVLLVGGAIADRTSRQKVIVRADIVAMIAQLSVAYMFITQNATLPMLTAFMLLNGMAAAFTMPAATGLVTQLVEKEDLQSVNALLGAARNFAVTMGAAIGGMLVAFLGPGLTILIDGLSFGLAACLVFFLKPRAQEVLESSSILLDLKLGWSEFTSHTWLWTVVLQFSLVVAALEAVIGLLGPAIMREQMGGAMDWGFVTACFGAGTILGGAASFVIKVKRPIFFATLMVFPFALVPFALSVPMSLPVICLAALLAGIGGEIFGVLWFTTLQHKVPGNMLSRVSAYDHLGSISLAPLGIVAAGFLYESLGPQTTLIIAGLAVVIPTVLVLFVRDVRETTLGEV